MDFNSAISRFEIFFCGKTCTWETLGSVLGLSLSRTSSLVRMEEVKKEVIMAMNYLRRLINCSRLV